MSEGRRSSLENKSRPTTDSENVDFFFFLNKFFSKCPRLNFKSLKMNDCFNDFYNRSYSNDSRNGNGRVEQLFDRNVNPSVAKRWTVEKLP